MGVLPFLLRYCKNVVANSRALTAALIRRGYSFVTDGTDNHLSMWDVRPQGQQQPLLTVIDLIDLI